MTPAWIGVDLDGTLATYGDWRGPTHIGEPIPEMIERVRQWRRSGMEVRIMTARVWGPDTEEVRKVIENWCLTHIGEVLPITNEKDYGMLELWDDRVIQVEKNTGRQIKDCGESYQLLADLISKLARVNEVACFAIQRGSLTEDYNEDGNWTVFDELSGKYDEVVEAMTELKNSGLRQI